MSYLIIFYSVLKDLGAALIIIGAFYFGRHMSKTYKNKLSNYAIVLGAVIFLSLSMWYSYGTHTENVDPLRGGGETVVDFEVTDKEKNEYGWTTFFELIIPALFGVFKGQKFNPAELELSKNKKLK